MKTNRTKYIVLLVMAAICIGMALAADSDEQSKNGAGSTAKITQKESTGDERGSTDGDGKFSFPENTDMGVGELSTKLLLAILIVVVFGTVAIYISKKVLPKFTNLSGRHIQVVETVHLGQRRNLHLIKVGDQEILIGSTNENINRLADVTDFSSALAMTESSKD